MDVRKEKREKWHAPKRKKHSRAVHRQEPWKVQQKRRVVEGKSGELFRY